MKDVYAVLLAGGKGTRLWPLSTERCSKPFVRIGKGKTLIELAMERLKGFIGKKNTLVVIDRLKAGFVKDILPRKNIIVEPFGRSTASAVGLAAINLNPNRIMAVFSADQLVSDKKKFRQTLKESTDFIRKNKDMLLCIGITPCRPSTSYGYIKLSKKIKGNIFKVEKFVEKPPLKKAKIYLRNKKYVWNAGMFVFTAGAFLTAAENHAPILSRELKNIKKNKTGIKSSYLKMENVSLDYQIMEKAPNICCVKGGFGWDDIGGWLSMQKLLGKDKKGNMIVGKAVAIDTADSVIYNTGKKSVGVIGVEGMIIVNTDNGVLVSSKKDAERVKEIANRVK